jgi:hypothetical protein
MSANRAVISPNAIETAMAGKSLGLLAVCPSGVPPLSAYAYQRSVSLLLAQERVRAGLAAARRRGRRGGRPLAIDAEKLAAIVAALEGGVTQAAVCRTFSIKRSTLIDSLARIGWSASLKDPGGMGDTTTAIDRSPDRRTVRSAYGST